MVPSRTTMQNVSCLLSAAAAITVLLSDMLMNKGFLYPDPPESQ